MTRYREAGPGVGVTVFRRFVVELDSGVFLVSLKCGVDLLEAGVIGSMFECVFCGGSVCLRKTLRRGRFGKSSLLLLFTIFGFET